MKSVEALRKWADGLRDIWINPNDNSIIVTTCDDMPPSIDCVNLREHVNAILDGIEREVGEMQRALTIDAKPMTDENMAADGWIRLPVDADGVPIRVGDVMDEQLPFGGYAAPAPVDTMELSRGAGGYGWMVRLDSESGAFINPKLLRHHHAPTVEDVLREFVDALDIDRCDDPDATIAEYAAKLRLAGEGE